MKILWVKSDFLHPTNRGGQIRSLEIVKRLHAHNEVHYLAYTPSLDSEGVQRAREYCSYTYPVLREIRPRVSLSFAVEFLANFASSLPLAIARYKSAAMQRKINEVLAAHSFDSIVCDFVFPSPNFSSLSDCVLFQHNVETMIWRRHTETAPDPLRRAYFRRQAQRMENWERRICRESAHVLAVSRQEADLMRQMFAVKNVSFVATGVDLDYFGNPGNAAPKADLVFIGSMDWMPNIDAVDYFVREVLPLIRKRKPDCTLAIVGRSPSAATRALVERDPMIQVPGTVPDVRPWLWGSSVSVVPLRIGGGTRLKIYESMAARVPVVSTSIGAEGLDVSHPANIRLADNPEAFANECIQLLGNAGERDSLAANALHLVSSRFSWDAIAQAFENALLQMRDKIHPMPLPALHSRS